MADERTADDFDLDETLEETFPASDAPANTVETGTRVGGGVPGEAPGAVVIDNRQAHRFELTVDGQTAVLTYERQAGSLALIHTEVPPGLRGHHLADRLAQAALDAAHADRLQVVAVCPFVRDYLRRHPQAAS